MGDFVSFIIGIFLGFLCTAALIFWGVNSLMVSKNMGRYSVTTGELEIAERCEVPIWRNAKTIDVGAK